jgi:hypothetical protein
MGLCFDVVGSMARRRGVEYESSFQFLMLEEKLNLSTSVAHLKRFFSTTKHTNKSFLSKITLSDMEHPSQDKRQTNNLKRTRARKLKCGN